MRFEDQRQRLAAELRFYGIKDERVLQAIETVPREKFVLPEFYEYSYRNQPLPIEFNQTISQPLMIAIMLEQLELNADDTVLEIGTGSGYQTALLACVVKEVCTIERIEALSLKAHATLNSLGYTNIFYKIGDGTQGWHSAYPVYKEFPKIIVSAAADTIPDKLLEQLSDPGIMVIPVGKGHLQELVKISKSNGEIKQSMQGGCAFVPLITH